MLEIGEYSRPYCFLHATLASFISLDSLLVKELPIITTPGSTGKNCLGAFTDIIYLEIIADVIRQELMSFTGNFPHKSQTVFNSTPVVFFQPQLLYIFLSKGICFMYKLASALFMLNLCNQYNNERSES